jgi:hypothetical protein
VKPLKIYVAAPYTGDEQANVDRAVDAGIELIRKGHVPFIPHLTHYIEMRLQERGETFDYEVYMKYDGAWVSSCDALLQLASSLGADRELHQAAHEGKIIFLSLDEVPDVS